MLAFTGLARGLRGKECLPTPETWVQSLDREDHLEKEVPTHSSILTWKILWPEETPIVHGAAKESDTIHQLNSNSIVIIFNIYNHCI